VFFVICKLSGFCCFRKKLEMIFEKKKSLSKWNRSWSCQQAFFLSSYLWAINWSFLFPLYSAPSLPSIHLRQATKARTVMHKQKRTNSYVLLTHVEIDSFITIIIYIFIMVGSFNPEYNTITHHFMPMNCPIMVDHLFSH
jgi:hypothetical protein